MFGRIATIGTLAAGALAAAVVQQRASVDATTCTNIAAVISKASAVYYPGSANYTADNEHWIPSSSEVSTCTVQPGTAQDVAAIIKVLNGTTSPFGIKSGGHGTDLGFSSTTGVQIALTRLNSVSYSKTANTVTFGAGQAWSDLYPKLEQYGVMVAGGRIVSVGVGGFILGGGYSWLTNAHGWGDESVVSFEVVLPTAQIVTASASSNPDLFFALKGGFNNYGIVTSVTMTAFPQGQIYGGTVTYDVSQQAAAISAMAKFQANNKDGKGNLVGLYIVDVDGTKTLAAALFYNSPTAPAGYFDSFTSIPYSSKDMSTRSFVDFITVTSPPFNNPTNLRGEFNSVSVPILNQVAIDIIVNTTNYYGVGGAGSFGPGTKVVSTIEPFLASGIVNSDTSKMAIPHDQYSSPTNIFVAWPSTSLDAAGRKAIRAMGNDMRAQLQSKVSNLANSLPLYGNYALGDASVPQMYGVNYSKLQSIRAKYDPFNVMRRTGGFKI